MSLPGTTVSAAAAVRWRLPRMALKGLLAGLALTSLAGCVADGYYTAPVYTASPAYDYYYPYYGYGYGYGFYGYPYYVGVGGYFPRYYGGWGHGGYWHGHPGWGGGHWGGGHWGGGHWGGPIHH
ncbi:hypothetical protein [Azospirillum sp. B4]|uniref:hypothetical protein n=1 Tax=Azospirillum sp. B4 TaxID=95605 RepID=UPI0005C906D5|nr:hypothetical protein [Azospirillum sp. B4]